MLVARRATIDEGHAAVVDVADDRLRALRHGEQRSAPVDAQVIARLLEDRLQLVAESEDRKIARLFAAPRDLLVRDVHRPLRGHVEVNAYVVARTIERARAEEHVRRGSREEFGVVKKQRAQELHLELDRAGLESIDR